MIRVVSMLVCAILTDKVREFRGDRPLKMNAAWVSGEEGVVAGDSFRDAGSLPTALYLIFSKCVFDSKRRVYFDMICTV